MLSPEWRAWVAENLLHGAPTAKLVAALVAQGVPEREATTQVGAIAASPGLIAGARYAKRARSLEVVARLHREVMRAGPREVERRPEVSADEFFARYYATNTPVVLTDVVTRWPAFERWSLAWLRERYGHAEVQAVFGREADPDYDMNTPRHSRATTLGEFISAVEAAGETNDLYLVANNRNMERPALRPLWDDLSPDPAIIDRARLPGSTALWVGPAGTVTPLHHDTSNILFAQLRGRKRFVLAPPSETSLLRRARGVYCDLDPEGTDPDWAAVRSSVVTLAPGEALFLPVGWWHHVRALDVSVSFAFTNFTRPNAFDWYKPARG